jgi:hypothetical protein
VGGSYVSRALDIATKAVRLIDTHQPSAVVCQVSASRNRCRSLALNLGGLLRQIWSSVRMKTGQSSGNAAARLEATLASPSPTSPGEESVFRAALVGAAILISAVSPTSDGPVVRPTAMQCPPGYDEEQPGCVEKPDASSGGSSAQCRDGSYSHSRHHSGTCSRHGGVAQWESYKRQGIGGRPSVNSP